MICAACGELEPQEIPLLGADRELHCPRQGCDAVVSSGIKPVSNPRWFHSLLPVREDCIESDRLSNPESRWFMVPRGGSGCSREQGDSNFMERPYAIELLARIEETKRMIEEGTKEGVEIVARELLPLIGRREINFAKLANRISSDLSVGKKHATRAVATALKLMKERGQVKLRTRREKTFITVRA